MKMLFTFLISFIGMSVIAQDSWKVCLDKKVLLNTSTEDAEKNVTKISSADLRKSKTFAVSYKETSPQKGWERTITVYDEKDNELKRQTGKKLTLKASELKTLLDKYKTIKIYTINFPTDPKMKAQVRLRRVHLCTLVLQ
jgi:hypothetical protein